MGENIEENKNIPAFLKEKLKKQFGEELSNKIIDGYSTNRVTSFRVNNLKSNYEKIEEILKENNIDYKKPEWSKDAFIVENDMQSIIEELDIYKNGEIYIQSLSSMLPPIILDPKEGEDILDMTAAPGGKTTQMASMTNNKANITACEMNQIRAERLKYNIEKQGASRVFCLVKDSRKLEDFFSFDKILLDAPCSGSGTLNVVDDKIEKYFTEKLIEKSKKSQLSLIEKAIKILKPGKEMVYSTCSILQEENEEIINKELEKGNLEIVPIDFDGIESLPLLPTKISGTLCVCPTELYEGFFVAKLRKRK